MSFLETLNNVVISQQGRHSPENTLNIDGLNIQGIRNVKIEYGINFGIPIVTIEFYAKVKGSIKVAQGVIEKETETIDKEAWKKLKAKGKKK